MPNRTKGMRRWLVVVVAAFVSIGGFAALQATPAAAATNWPADAYQYCYNTVPSNGVTSISYGGLFFRPDQNSVNTTCRDVVQNSWFWWTSSRPINWALACQYTYGHPWPYVWNNHVYCYR